MLSMFTLHHINLFINRNYSTCDDVTTNLKQAIQRAWDAISKAMYTRLLSNCWITHSHRQAKHIHTCMFIFSCKSQRATSEIYCSRPSRHVMPSIGNCRLFLSIVHQSSTNKNKERLSIQEEPTYWSYLWRLSKCQVK